jgi:biopolymer transport protein ExbB/TolQ
MFIQKNNQILAGVAIAAAFSLITIIGYRFSTPGSSMETLFFALGGKMPDGIIQAGTIACFFICFFAVQALNKRLQWEEAAYHAKLLPESEQYILYAEDVSRIKLQTIEAEKHMGVRMLTDLIKQATTKFRADHSTAETLSMVETMSDMQRRKLEKEFALISVCQNLIPALGFLGTVWGMAAAILTMGDSSRSAQAAATTPGAAPAAAGLNSGDIQGLIDSMGTAFFTTILSIVLGIVVTILVKQLETRSEEFHNNLKRYVVENLVNRIHK